LTLVTQLKQYWWCKHYCWETKIVKQQEQQAEILSVIMESQE